MAIVLQPETVADPGFFVGGAGPIGAVWTSNMGAFHQKCMQKQNWIP